MPPVFQDRLEKYQQRVDAALDRFLPADDPPEHNLAEAIRYSVIGGGKRIRPAMVYAAGEAMGVATDLLDIPASAVEMIHAYSLIHDDLPAMDDDDLRRGRPTVHRAFDEATAILAGDALQALAYEILAKQEHPELDAEHRIAMLSLLTEASGAHGMAGGQAVDLAAVGKALSLEQLEHMHQLKTGALIRASVLLGAMCKADISNEEIDILSNYARCIGLSFQIQDDILDVISDTETLGKPQGSDQAQQKPTFPAILGLENAIERAQEQHRLALKTLEPLDEKADSLRQLSAYIVERRY
ncbi:MAG TPA: (2E,6E)-farnesyl diphosphate synthase [Gammaproteobacteria bacterium]|nr:(2E,6E)-farnesyl diphosphate synthase [Gammaproteobacteria bacterium]